MADLDPNKALAIKALLESRLPPATEGEDLATHLAEQIRHREMSKFKFEVPHSDQYDVGHEKLQTLNDGREGVNLPLSRTR